MKNTEESPDKADVSKTDVSSLNNSMQLPQQFLQLPQMMFGQYGGMPSYPQQEFQVQQNGSNSNSAQHLTQPIMGTQVNPYVSSLPQNYMMNFEMFHNMMRFYNPSFFAMQQQLGGNYLGSVPMMLPPQQFASQLIPQPQPLYKEFAENKSYSVNSTNAEDNSTPKESNNIQNSFACYLANQSRNNIADSDRSYLVSDNVLPTDCQQQPQEKNFLKHSDNKEEVDVSLPTKSELIVGGNPNYFSPELQASNSDYRKENQTPNKGHQDFDQKYLFPNKNSFERPSFQKQDFDSFLQDNRSKNTISVEQKLEREVCSENLKTISVDELSQSAMPNQNNSKNGTISEKRILDTKNPIKIEEEPIEKSKAISRQHLQSNFDEQQTSFLVNVDHQKEHLLQKGRQIIDQTEPGYSSGQQIQKQKSFDETPINGKPTKRFEELLEEQLRKNPTAVSQKRPPSHREEKRTFLKRGSRQFLSNAASRVNKKTDSPKEGNLEDDSLANLNREQLSKKSKSTRSLLNKSQLSKDNKESLNRSFDDKCDRNAEPTERKLSQPRKFLAKGKGTGGGKGNINQQQQLTDPDMVKSKTYDCKATHQEGNRSDLSWLQTSKSSKSRALSSSSEEAEYEKSLNKLKLREKEAEAEVEEVFGDQEEAEDSNSLEKYYNEEQYLKSRNLSSNKKLNQSYDLNDVKNWISESQTKSSHDYSSGKKSLPNIFQESQQNVNTNIKPKSNMSAKKHFNDEKGKTSQSIDSERKGWSLQMGPVDEELQKIVDDKIEALNSEIAKFKLENERVKKIRQRYEDMLKELNFQIEEFDRKRAQEREEFESWKEEEMKKIRNKEKLLIQKSSQVLTNNSIHRKDREEIELLKEQLHKCQEEMKSRDHRNKLVIDRLKKQNEELNNQNVKLQQEVALLEKNLANGGTRQSGRTPDPKQRSMSNPNLIKGNLPVFKYQSEIQKRQPSIGKSRKSIYEEAADEEDEEDNVLDDEKNAVQSPRLSNYFDEDNDRQEQVENNEEDDEDRDEVDNYEDIISPNVKNYYYKEKIGENTKIKKPIIHSQNFTESQKAGRAQESRAGSYLFEYASNMNQNTQAESTDRKDNSNQMLIKGNNPIRENEFAHIRTILMKKQFGENDYKYNSNPYYKRAVSSANTQGKVLSETISNDGKVQRIFENGKKEIIFHNGVKKEVFSNGYTIVYFMNNDIKQTFPDGTIVYYFSDANTTQTSLVSSTQIYRFANNQIEFHNSDGTKEIYFSDGTKKFINSNTEEYTIFADGTTQKVTADNIKYIDFINGQKDTIYEDGSKVRMFPDGKIKKYPPTAGL